MSSPPGWRTRQSRHRQTRRRGDRVVQAASVVTEEAPRGPQGASRRSEGTGPELRVQRAARALGLNFRVNVKDLPGSPDLVFDDLRTALFVNGCFWHSHPGCPGQRIPFPEDGAKRAFWHEKLIRNVLRDERVASELEHLDWQVAVLWDCQTRPRATLIAALRALRHVT